MLAVGRQHLPLNLYVVQKLVVVALCAAFGNAEANDVVWSQMARGNLGAAVSQSVLGAAISGIGVDLVALGKASEAVSSSRAQHLGSFDLILCNQVFEHVRDPWSAARGLSKLLKPGGLLIFTVPFLAKYHEVPKDYFRFTPDGAAAIFEDAGMKVLRRHVGGSSMYTSAYLLGFGTGDFDSTVHDSHALMEAKRYNIGRPRDADYSNTDLTRHNRSLFLESGLVLQRPTSENARA